MGIEHMTSTRFMPGKSGNPHGRKKGQLSLKPLLQRLLSTEIEAHDFIRNRMRRMTGLEVMAIALIRKALNGDTRAFKEIIDRVDGPVRSCVEIDSERSLPSTEVVIMINGVKADDDAT